MQRNDIIEIKEMLVKMTGLLVEIKDLLKENQTQRESKLPRSI
jgi:hypothetical protein